jgi:3',5'-cyclic-AMP phosphodiesterase
VSKTLAHVSDLHFGLASRFEAAAAALVQMLIDHAVDHVVVSGDLTHRGRWQELERFWACLSPLREATELSVVPGNHDRLGDDVAGSIMNDHRVLASRHDGLRVVRLDSTGPHNARHAFQSHGLVHDEDLRELDLALRDPHPGELVVVTMHHHPLPLPEESSLERLSAWLRLPFTTELAMGRELLACLRGRCDLLLHGHRHVPGERELFGDDDRPLQVVNAGSSAEMRRVRVFEHHDGRLLGPARWLCAPERPSAKVNGRAELGAQRQGARALCDHLAVLSRFIARPIALD